MTKQNIDIIISKKARFIVMNKETIFVGSTEVLVKGYAEKAERLAALSEAIDRCNESVTQKGLDVAGILGKIFDGNLYSLDGSKSIGEYSEKRFGIKKAQASALCKAARLFLAETSDESNEFVALLPITAGVCWNVTQLTELSRAAKKESEVRGVVDALIEDGKINSTMSAKAIRETLGALTDKEAEDGDGSETEAAKVKNAEKQEKAKADSEQKLAGAQAMSQEIAEHLETLGGLVKKSEAEHARGLSEAIIDLVQSIIVTLGGEQ